MAYKTGKSERWFAIFGAAALLAAGCGGAPDPAKPTESPSSQPAKSAAEESPREPATLEQATKVLNLQTFPVPDGVKLLHKAVGAVSYETKDPTKKAFEFASKHLTEAGWKQQPDARVEDAYAQASFTREGFFATISASPTGDGETLVSIHNYGNVPASQAPAPADLTSEYSFPHTAGFVTKTAKIPETAEAIHKLLVSKGWQPYGGHKYDQKFSAGQSMNFKRNAIMLQVSVTTHENRPGETMVQYTMKQLSSDLPAPSTAAADSLHYSDRDQRLTFDTPDKTDDVANFYRETLGKQGWKPTTEPKGLTNMSLIFRNPAKDMIMLDVKGSKPPTHVTARYYTAAQVAELDKRIKEREGKDKAKEEEPK